MRGLKNNTFQNSQVGISELGNSANDFSNVTESAKKTGNATGIMDAS